MANSRDLQTNRKAAVKRLLELFLREKGGDWWCHDDTWEIAMMEYRSYKDDAWYDACVETQSNGNNGGNDLILRVKLSGFPDDHDEVLDGKDLRSIKDVEKLGTRFRAMSAQLQDSECCEVHKGMIVCAVHSSSPDDRRFYDAVVDGVVRHNHGFENGEEQCTCTFLLLWQHGPNKGMLTPQVLENICRVTEPPLPVEKLNPMLTSFLKSATDSISSSRACPRKTARLNNGHKLNQDTRLGKRSSIDLTGDDIDIGGAWHMIIIDNLEKGISPSTIMKFIHQQLSLSCQVFVSPSRLQEAYSRGAVLLHSKKTFDKLSVFLENPDHIIVSARGRPWVMTEKTSLHGALRAVIETFVLTSQEVVQNRRTGTYNELKVVTSGTKEYMEAKQLQDLFMEFAKHQIKLHERLVIEEGRILQLPGAV